VLRYAFDIITIMRNVVVVVVVAKRVKCGNRRQLKFSTVILDRLEWPCLVTITAGESLHMDELKNVFRAIRECASLETTLICGTVLQPSLGDYCRATIVATGSMV